jgi:hypothetical protein
MSAVDQNEATRLINEMRDIRAMATGAAIANPNRSRDLWKRVFKLMDDIQPLIAPNSNEPPDSA